MRLDVERMGAASAGRPAIRIGGRAAILAASLCAGGNAANLQLSFRAVGKNQNRRQDAGLPDGSQALQEQMRPIRKRVGRYPPRRTKDAIASSTATTTT